MRVMVLALFLAAFISPASAVFWNAEVDNVTDGSYWGIHRQSDNISFNMSGMVEGEIAPIQVTPSGRVLVPSHLRYADVGTNDVFLKERTAALEGLYSSEEEIHLESTVSCIYMDVNKPNNSKIWTIEFGENWPVNLNATRSVDYVGQGINDRECIGNSLSGVSTEFLYNRELNRDRDVKLRLNQMNATVVATNDTIIETSFMPNSTLDYQLLSHSTGIADLKYWRIGTDRLVAGYGEERYDGTYNINRKILIRSDYPKEENETDWLSCCIGETPNGVTPGIWDSSSVFNCPCP